MDAALSSPHTQTQTTVTTMTTATKEEESLRAQLQLEREKYDSFHASVQGALDRKNAELMALTKELTTLKKRARGLEKEQEASLVRAKDHANWLEEIYHGIVDQVYGKDNVPAEHRKVHVYKATTRVNWGFIQERTKAIESFYPLVNHFMMNFVEEIDDDDDVPPCKRPCVIDDVD
jgi:seryl-tRNA synthetase